MPKKENRGGQKGSKNWKERMIKGRKEGGKKESRKGKKERNEG